MLSYTVRWILILATKTNRGSRYSCLFFVPMQGAPVIIRYDRQEDNSTCENIVRTSNNIFSYNASFVRKFRLKICQVYLTLANSTLHRND